MSSSYISKKAKLLKSFDKTADLVREYAVSCYGEDLTDTLTKEAREEYEELIPQIPRVGRRMLNSFLRISAMELAVFKAMKKKDLVINLVGKRTPTDVL